MGGDRTSGSMTGLGGGLRKLMQPTLRGLITPGGGQRTAAMQNLMLDPAQYSKIGDVLSQTAFGQNLNVGDTAAGRNLVSGLTNQSNMNLGQNLANLRSQFALSGQNLSGPLAQTSAQAMVDSQKNLDATLAEQEFGQYGAERVLQQQGLAGLASYQQTPASLFGSLAGLNTKSSQTAPYGSPMSMITGK